MIIHPHVIQADLIADLKGTASITDLLATAAEVREDQYQGTDWRYSTLRLAILGQTPIVGPEPCDLTTLAFTVRVYTEGGSSKDCSILLGAINDRYHRRIFDADTWICWLLSVGMLNPERVGEKIWRGEALFEGTVYPKSGAL